MSAPILATKLYTPPPRSKVVLRPRLIKQLNENLQRTPGMTLISAPAGFGKTTLVSEWVAGCERPVAWLSLDEGDSDLTRFLTYVVAALQTLARSGVEGTAVNIGAGVLSMLQASQLQSLPIELILTNLLNEIAALPDQSALHGLLKKVRDLGMPLLSINHVESSAADTPDTSKTQKYRS